jgi:hypothetical protein
MPLDLSRYLVEWYRPDLTDELLELTTARIDDSADGLSVEGITVELLLTIVVPADEVVFCLFAAASAASVEQACRNAGCPFTRITEAITSPAQPRPFQPARRPS